MRPGFSACHGLPLLDREPEFLSTPGARQLTLTLGLSVLIAATFDFPLLAAQMFPQLGLSLRLLDLVAPRDLSALVGFV